MGGGGFSMEPDNPALDLYVLAQTRKRRPSVCFLATATGDADGYIERFYTAFKAYRCRPSHVPLFRRTPDLKQALLTQDVIYVGGGNTKSMLAVWRDWDVPRLLRRAWKNGTVLAGISAGAICWFRMGVTDSWGKGLTGMPCRSPPVESTVLRMRSMGTGNGVTRHVLSCVDMSRCQPHGVS